MKLPANTAIMGVAALAALGLVWWATRPGAAANIAQGVVGAVGGAATGAVKGIGELVGIPDTSQTQCQKDIAAGHWWDASFSCPAGTFLGSALDAGKTAVFGSTALSAAAAADARRVAAETDPRRVDLYPVGPSMPRYDPTPGIY